ncbi:MAG: acyltransferase domain-containing protein, partial [Polyangiaceae bacterium]
RELFELSAARGRCILEAAGEDPGTMAAVTGAPDAVRAEIAGIDGVVIANENAPDQTVISGRREAVAAAIARLEQKGMRARTFPVACAFHSPVVAAASATFAEHLAAATVRAPRLPVYANTSAAPHPADPAAIRRALAEHVARPVRFAAEIEAMYAAGVRTFIEVGPGRVLGGLVAKVLRDRPHRVIACDGNGEGSLRPLLAALAELAVGGTALDVTALFAGRGAKKIDLASAAPLRHPPSTWLVDGHLARPLHGEPPPGAFRALTAPVVAVAAPAPATAPGAAFTAQVVAAPADGRQAAVLEFLRASREIVEAQRQVLLAHLGEPATQGVARTFDPQRRGQPFDEQPSSLRPSAPPLPSFSPPARSLPPGARSVPPPSSPARAARPRREPAGCRRRAAPGCARWRRQMRPRPPCRQPRSASRR